MNELGQEQRERATILGAEEHGHIARGYPATPWEEGAMHLKGLA